MCWSACCAVRQQWSEPDAAASRRYVFTGVTIAGKENHFLKCSIMSVNIHVRSLRWCLRRRAPCGRVCDSGAASWALVHLVSSVVVRALCAWCSWPVHGLFTVVLVGQARRRAPCGRVCDSGAASWALVHLASSVVARALCTWCSWSVAAWALYVDTCRSGEEAGSLRSHL